MSTIIRAIVLTNSSDDYDFRVKLSAPLTWDESPLCRSVGGLALNKGDYVYVDISNGIDNPLILGRCICKSSKYSREANGNILWDSSDGNSWSIAFVKGKDLEIYNSSGLSAVINGSTVDIKGGNITISGGSLTCDGTVIPTGSGGFSCITACPFTGAVHVGNKVTNL